MTFDNCLICQDFVYLVPFKIINLYDISKLGWICKIYDQGLDGHSSTQQIFIEFYIYHVEFLHLEICSSESDR